MAGIYDLFKAAAKTNIRDVASRGANLVDKIPWNYRLLAGVGIGGVAGAMSDNPDLSLHEKMGKGMFLGGVAGLGVGTTIRAAGEIGTVGATTGHAFLTNRINQFQRLGVQSLMRPVNLAIAGAATGAIIAPHGHKGTGAIAGAGLGLAAYPGVKLFRGYDALGKVPGAQTGVLMAAAAGTIAAGVALGTGTPEGEGVATFGDGGTMDYAPLSGNMQDRMYAMNATGDIVLGLNGRKHG